jgi:hypothetical protein
MFSGAKAERAALKSVGPHNGLWTAFRKGVKKLFPLMTLSKGLTPFTPLRYKGHSKARLRIAECGMASFGFETESKLEGMNSFIH